MAFWLIAILVGINVILISIIVVRVIRSERENKEFRSKMSEGDEARILTGSGMVRGTISSIIDDDVVLSVRLKRKHLAPLLKIGSYPTGYYINS